MVECKVDRAGFASVERGRLEVVAAPLVALHVASDAEGLAAAHVRALERLLAGVGVAVNTERAGP